MYMKDSVQFALAVVIAQGLRFDKSENLCDNCILNMSHYLAKVTENVPAALFKTSSTTRVITIYHSVYFSIDSVPPESILDFTC